MQHTDKYNFNLIETSDPFSPDALNENTQKVEDVLATHKAVVDSALKSQKLEWEAADGTETAAREALAARVGALEQGRLVWTSGTYTGDGGLGKDHPTRIEFPFKPLMVIVKHATSYMFGGFPWIRGATDGISYDSNTATNHVAITWEDRAIQWYSNDNPNVSVQLNDRYIVYHYFALGVEE